MSIAGVSWEGRVVCALHQTAIRTWPAHCGGSAYAMTVRPNVQLERGVSRLLQAIGWSGIFQVQFIRDLSGDHYLIDLNPRVYGSLALAVAAGLNLPGIWADALLSRRPHVGDYCAGTRYRHEEYDLRALVRMLLDRKWRRFGRGCVPRRGTAHAIFSPRDPMPVLTSVERLARRLQVVKVTELFR